MSIYGQEMLGTPGLITPLQGLRIDRSAFSVATLAVADREDLAYWASQPPSARLQALELMRQVVYGYDPVADRIQRVLEVVERVSG